MTRRESRKIQVGGVAVGGGAPISIQSMTNTDTRDVERTVEQIHALEEAGCDIVRVAVPDQTAAQAVEKIRERIRIPLVCDIHFSYKLALQCVERGADKIRLNPGNIGSPEGVRRVAESCGKSGVPIRIGINGGSMEKSLLQKYGGVTAQGMVDSALNHVKLLTDCGFEDICISVKASSVPLTVEAYRLLAQRCSYPLHLGVTEAGTPEMGILKSAAGIGGLLCMGVGDTIRVSLTADPVEEVHAARKLLKAIGLRQEGANLVSCPTCGRCKTEMIPLAQEVERRLKGVDKPITVAVMGCAVNGPGEARNADVGIACGQDCGLLFAHGEILRKVPVSGLVEALFEEIALL